MELGEKVSYLRGMLDGMEIDTSKKEGKILVQMSEIMQEMAEHIEDLQSQVDELSELCDILDSDLGDVEEELYSLDGCSCGCEDDDEYDDCYDMDDGDLYEVCCPQCGNTFVLDESMIEEGSIDCPECGTPLEFDFNDVELAAEDNEEI